MSEGIMNNRIGLALRQLRIERGMTQADMARLLGLHRPAYTLIESGRQRLTAEQLLVVSEAMGVTLCDLEERIAWQTIRTSG